MHGVFEDTFLLEDKIPLFLVVGCASGPAIAIPPCRPPVLQGSAAVGTPVSTLFPTAGTVGGARAAAKEVSVAAEVSEEEGGEGQKDDDKDDVLQNFGKMAVPMVMWWKESWGNWIMAVVPTVVCWKGWRV